VGKRAVAPVLQPVVFICGSSTVYGWLADRCRRDPRSCCVNGRRSEEMLETIAIILIVLWLLGMVSGYTLGNFIYVLLVIAIVLFLVRLISGRRVV
jgi:hypothetical protein